MTPSQFSFQPGVAVLAMWIADDESVYRTSYELRREGFARQHFVGSLRGAKMRGRDGVFEQFGALLQFPAHFGNSWNAFRDCIADLDWLGTDGVVVLVLDADQILVDADPDEFDVLLDNLEEAAARMADARISASTTSFHVALHVAPDRATALASRLGKRTLPRIAQ